MMKVTLGKQGVEQQAFFDKEEEEYYNIITGRIKYKSRPMREYQLEPDLVLKIKVPPLEEAYLSRNKYLTISHFLTSPSDRIERAYNRAQKQISKEMEDNRENLDPQNIRIRLQLALKLLQNCSQVKKPVDYINSEQEAQVLQLNCLYEIDGILDAFKLEYNTILLILQRICGFNVRSFLLYNKELTERSIYLFLTMNTQNLLRVANKYRIKKEVDFTSFDYYLNDPTTSDSRPVRLNTKFKTDQQAHMMQKQISRYFLVKSAGNKNEEIVEQENIEDDDLDNFRNYSQESQLVFEYLKHKVPGRLNNHEKEYIFQHNRRKLNPGCEKIYALIKKRREFFQISKTVLKKYNYTVYEEPVCFEQFSLADKHSKGATFFGKLESILLYKPLQVAESGKLSLFLNMQRTKLAYMIIKNHFKINYLSKINMEIFTMDNEFEKSGKRTLTVDGENDLKGGIDGENLVDNWNFYSIFSNMKIIRNYFGDRVAYEVLYNNYAIGYLVSVLIAYTSLYIIEQIFYDAWFYTTHVEAFLLAISFKVFLFYFMEAEEEFIDNYCDAVESKVFLSKFRGPYRRNILTDEVNEFETMYGFSKLIKNLACCLIIVILDVIIGAIFHGCRMFLLEIYEPLSALTFNGIISLPHIIAYLLFVVVEYLFRLILVKKVIKAMIYLQNPPNDEEERDWEDTLTFFYVLSIQLVPLMFLLFIENFSGISCYADSCEYELTYYTYSRYIIILGFVLVRLGLVLWQNYLRALKDLMKQEEKVLFFEEKLVKLLTKAEQEHKKPEHIEQKASVLLNLQNFAFYNTLIPLSPIIMFLVTCIHFISFRLDLLYKERRPINKSENVIRASRQLHTIYFIGVFINAWINLFNLEMIELNMQWLIESVSNSISYQAIFLLKFFSTIVYCLLMNFAGQLFGGIATLFSGSAVFTRKVNKFKEYRQSRGAMKMVLRKSEQITPLKSIFRIHNPDKNNMEILDEDIYKIITITQQVNESNENIDSAVQLEKNL